MIRIHNNIYYGRKYAWFDDGPFVNNYPVIITIDAKEYKSVTHYINCQHALDTNNMELYNTIYNSTNAVSSISKAANIWSGKYVAMTTALVAKFTQNPGLGDILLNTAPLQLVYSDKRDSELGIAIDSTDTNRIQYAPLWCGKNILGQKLMNVRDHILKSCVTSASSSLGQSPSISE